MFTIIPFLTNIDFFNNSMNELKNTYAQRIYFLTGILYYFGRSTNTRDSNNSKYRSI